jgi:DNA-binding NarL/FixJ family response regulator
MHTALRVELVNGSELDARALTERLNRDGQACDARTPSSHDVEATGLGGPSQLVILQYPSDPAEVREVAEAMPDAWVVVLTPSTDIADLRQLIQAGADGILGSDDWIEPIGPMIRALQAGLLCIPQRARGALGPPPALTLRERQVLDLLTDGLTNAQIAQRLYLSESTVKTHVTAAFRRLGVSSRREAVALIAGSGWTLRGATEDREPIGIAH